MPRSYFTHVCTVSFKQQDIFENKGRFVGRDVQVHGTSFGALNICCRARSRLTEW